MAWVQLKLWFELYCIGVGWLVGIKKNGKRFFRGAIVLKYTHTGNQNKGSQLFSLSLSLNLVNENDVMAKI